MILTVAMLISGIPAVFAENDANSIGAVTEQEAISDNQDEITKDNAEEISGEGEKNSEEQISLMSGENDVSLLANETDEVQYSTDGSTWTGSTFDNIWSEAEKIANKGKSYQIKVSKDFSLTENKEYSLSYGVKVTIYADTDVTITVPTSTKIIVKSGGQYNGGDATLTFGKSGAAGTVTFDGKNEKFSEAAFRAEGSSGNYMGHLVINDGVSIKNFKRSQGGTYYGIIYNNGQLDINGGSITNNEISSNTVDSVIFNCRKLNIAGGEISNNSITSYDGYIVMVRGSSAEFTMTGGKIVSNNVRKTVIQLAQDDSSYQGSATITKGTIANNKGYSYSDDNFTADARDISIGASLTKLTLNGTAEIGTIETNVKNINNSKFITIASGFAPATPISVLVAMSYIGGQVYPSEGMQVATVENGASINGKLVYYNTDFSISDDGKLAAPPEARLTYQLVGQTNATKDMTYADALKFLKDNNVIQASTKLTVLKSFEVSEPWTYGTSPGFNAAEGLEEKPVITRAADYTGPIIKLSSGTLKVSDVVLDGESRENIDSPLITVTSEGSGVETNLILENVVLRNNKNSGSDSKGGAVSVIGGITARKVEFQNCSAKYGGAVYYDLKNSPDHPMFSNCVFDGNAADTGSAFYINSSDSMQCNFVINGCTFRNNKFVNNEGQTDSYTKNTTIYANPKKYMQTIDFYGNTSFEDNTLSDIFLDGNAGTFTNGANIRLCNSLNQSSLDVIDAPFVNSGSRKIKIAVGQYSRNVASEPPTGYIVNIGDLDKAERLSQFELAPANGTTLGENHFLLSKAQYYLVIRKPNEVYMNYISNKQTYTSCEAYNAANPVTLTVSPNLNVEKIPGSGRKAEKASEGKNYTIKATANNANINKMYIEYKDSTNLYAQAKKIEAEIATDKKSASLMLTSDIISTIYNINYGTANIYIEYEVLSQHITVVQSTGGTISATPSDKAAKGATVTLTATPDAEYDFSSWNVYKTGDMSAKVTLSGNTFTMPDYPVTVSAVFVKKTHAVLITKGGEGTVAISPETPVEVGQTVKVTVTPDEYWELSRLTMNGTDITSAKSFVMPNNAVELKAAFVKQKFSVTASATTNGMITLLTNSPFNWGGNFTINVKADPHYEIETVTVDGSPVTVDGQGDYTFEMPTHDVIVSATFKKVKYTITGTGDHATFSIPSSDTYNWGDTVEFTVTPDEWYSVESVTIAGVEVTDKGNGSYSFTMPTNDVEIKITAVRPNFNITFVSNGGSSVDGQVIANGNTVAKPSTPTYVNHGFAGWYTSPTFEADTKYDFGTKVTGNVTLYARWFLWGDVNGDGKVTPFDAVQLDRCYVGSVNVESLAVPMAARVTEANKTKPTPFDSV